MMECPECRGSGLVMTRDGGVCGAEEYGTCRRCRGAGEVNKDTAPETLVRRIDKLERHLREATQDKRRGELDR